MNKYRNLLILPFHDDHLLTVAVDNSGGIGEKADDSVKISYDVVSYFGARVCIMETLAAGSVPKSFIIHSFNNEKAWDSLVEGATRAFKELGLKIDITGSTESNFSLKQSAMCFTLIGTVNKQDLRKKLPPNDVRYAVVGTPLVGEEILNKGNEILPLELFQKLCSLAEIYEIIPVGSKGIKEELKEICSQTEDPVSDLPLYKSAGPSSCVLISYDRKNEKLLKDLAGDLFSPLY